MATAMCGINGILNVDGAPVRAHELLASRDSMSARGPDGAGEWVAGSRAIALGHRRLAIIDPTTASDQPMSFAQGRYRIVFNGEIYNYRALRQRLVSDGVEFRSSGDTEVLLALYARRGPSMLGSLRGMYSFAIWDEREQSLFLARDPYGIKPLYYAFDGRSFRFASQVKALEAGGGVSREPDPAGVVGFLLWGSVPEPATIRRGIRSLPRGHFMTVAGGRVGVPQRAEHDPEPALPRTLAGALEDSVTAHLEADVPVAVFLSGGLDSALIAALARRRLESLTTLTLGFDRVVPGVVDETAQAEQTARVLGTRQVTRRIDPGEFRHEWQRSLEAMDQPSIDGFNVFLMSRFAREAGFKVVLSGIGGDELLGGYTSFREVPSWRRWARRCARVPGLGRAWPKIAPRLAPAAPKLAGFLRHGGTTGGAYFLRRGLFLPEELSRIVDEDIVTAGLKEYDAIADANTVAALGSGARGAWEAVHEMESGLYLRNQLLRDADWAAMAHSVELRTPLADERLRFAASRVSFEPARSGGKARAIAEAAPELPAALLEREKTGFSLPIAEWLPDLEIPTGVRPGKKGSRALALRVLQAFGVAVKIGERPRRASSAAPIPSRPA